MKKPSERQSGAGDALAGLRVIDLSHYLAGPFCTKLFADFGADVIKVERPGAGDGSRRIGPFPGGVPDPEASGLFLYLNTNKRGITLDLKTVAGRNRLLGLIASADVLVESFRPGVMSRLGLGWDTISSLNPRLVMTSISNFGQTGPYRDYLASDLIHYGMAGFSYLNGDGVREPLKGPPAQSQYQAGMTGFVATMTALMGRETTGAGQQVDVSIHEAVCATIQPMILRAVMAGTPAQRAGILRAFPSGFFECGDGYIYLYAPRPLSWVNLLTALGLDPALADDPRFATGYQRSRNEDEVRELLRPGLMARSREELFAELKDWGAISGMAVTIDELFHSEHLAERGFFVDLAHRHAGKLRYPGAPFRMSATPWRLRSPAPVLGEHNREVLGDSPADSDQPALHPRRAVVAPLGEIPPEGQSSSRLPLAGIRIIDLTQAWSGTFATCLLADMGADVIKIEARNRPDPWRGPMSPEAAAVASHGYPGGATGPRPYNRSSLFHGVNRNKRGITLDLATAEGVAIFKELVKIGDIVAENFTSRVMPNLGLGYEVLSELNPAVIMLSMPAYGTTGPYKDARGVGGSVEPMSGMSSLGGYPDGPPMNHGAMYPDPVAGMMAAAALLVALHHRRKTGNGQFIDLSQQETTTLLLGEALMDYAMNGNVASRQGNRHPRMAPHQNYRCRGEDDWLAIAIAGDDQWRRLADVIGGPDWCRDERFTTVAGRLAHADELDRCIEAWTVDNDRFDLARRLQDCGIAAGAVLRTREVVDDPHLRARGYIAEVDYGEAGRYPTPGLAWKMSATPGRIWRTAPDLGGDSESVLRELLGISRACYRALVEKRVTGEDPVLS